jgi:hypothetical protein
MKKYYPIKGFEKTHLISKDGEVLRLPTKTCHKNLVLKLQKMEYPRIQLCKKTYMLHRVLYETFIGEIPKDKQINHIDGNKWNYDLNNLEVCTQSENRRHAERMGLMRYSDRKGSLNPNAKISEVEVFEIRKIFNKVKNAKLIAKSFPQISYSTVRQICYGKTWKSCA